MMVQAPTPQVFEWNGRSGNRWARHQTRLDDMLAPLGNVAMVLAEVRRGEHVLDVGCGAGATTLDIARATGPSGRALGLDVSQVLIDRARERARELASPARFQLGDAAVAPLEAGSFDVIYSRFGVMFFEEPAAAFAHLREALKPNGRVAFVCWRPAAENDWIRLPMNAIRDLVPPMQPVLPEEPGPFSFGDRGRIARILDAAGFGAVEILPVDRRLRFGRGESREAAIRDAVEQAFEVGPLERALAGHSDEVRLLAAEAVHKAFASRATDEGVMIDGAAWIVTARKAS